MSEWISVEKALPADGQTVAFVVDCKSEILGYLHGRVLGGYFSYIGPYPTFSVPGLGLSASHWMPLPNPPQLRDHEPETTGRHCPLDGGDEDVG